MDGAALIMRAVAEGGASSAGLMREAALAEGAMLHHLASAVAGKVSPWNANPVTQPSGHDEPRAGKAELGSLGSAGTT